MFAGEGCLRITSNPAFCATDILGTGVLDTESQSPEESAASVLEVLTARGLTGERVGV